jgi:hypothetical protein
MMANLGMKIYKAADDLGLKKYVEENDPKRMVRAASLQRARPQRFGIGLKEGHPEEPRSLLRLDP